MDTLHSLRSRIRTLFVLIVILVLIVINCINQLCYCYSEYTLTRSLERVLSAGGPAPFGQQPRMEKLQDYADKVSSLAISVTLNLSLVVVLAPLSLRLYRRGASGRANHW